MSLRVFLLLVLVASNLGAEKNWNRFRGINGDGTFPKINLPLEWDKKEHTWEISLPGTGHASPVIWGNRIFTTCASASDATQYVLSIDCKSGMVVWQKEFLSAPYSHHKFNSYASSTPAVDQDYLFVSWTTKKSNDLICLDHDGKLIWRRDFGAFQTQHGNGFSPIVHKKYVVVTHDHEADSAIYALDRETGETIWKVDRIGSKPSSSTPMIFEANDGKCLVVSNSQSHGCYAVNLESGKIAWETGSDSLDKRSVSSPYFAGGHFFASCGSGGRGSRFLIIKPPSGKNQGSRIQHTITQNAPYVPTSLVIDDFVFVLSDAGIASAIDLKSGDTLWRKRIDGNFFASPVISGKMIFACSTDGKVFTMQASRDGLQSLGISRLEETTHNTPAISKNGIFFRTFSKLIHIRAKS